MREKNNLILASENPDVMKSLTEGTKLYSASYEWNAEKNESIFKVDEFIFRKYEENKTTNKNHTDVQLQTENEINAILYLESSPSVDIHQDISTSFYLTPNEAALSFRDGIAEVLRACNEWIESPNQK